MQPNPPRLKKHHCLDGNAIPGPSFILPERDSKSIQTHFVHKANIPVPLEFKRRPIKSIALAFLYRFLDHFTFSFLLLKRPGDEKWEPPEGKIESGETNREGCIREVREEVGLIIDPDPLDITFFTQNSHFVIEGHPFIAPINGDKIVLSSEHIDYQFYPYNDALKIIRFNDVKCALMYANLCIQEKVWKDCNGQT